MRPMLQWNTPLQVRGQHLPGPLQCLWDPRVSSALQRSCKWGSEALMTMLAIWIAGDRCVLFLGDDLEWYLAEQGLLVAGWQH